MPCYMKTSICAIAHQLLSCHRCFASNGLKRVKIEVNSSFIEFDRARRTLSWEIFSSHVENFYFFAFALYASRHASMHASPHCASAAAPTHRRLRTRMHACACGPASVLHALTVRLPSAPAGPPVPQPQEHQQLHRRALPATKTPSHAHAPAARTPPRTRQRLTRSARLRARARLSQALPLD